MELKVQLLRLMISLSKALDFDRQGITEHHTKVAFVAARLAKRLGLDRQQQFQILMAGLIHDIGVKGWDERNKLLKYKTEVLETHKHCQHGYAILKNTYFDFLAPIILSHHDHYQGDNSTGLNKEYIPLFSRIIFLSDRVCVLFEEHEDILKQSASILSQIEHESGTYFDPVIVQAFLEEGHGDAFWLALKSSYVRDQFLEDWVEHSELVELDIVKTMIQVFASIIDSKSNFTHLHSTTVAMVSKALGQMLDFSHEECEMMEIAGLLHDLGKLSVPNKILDKPGQLTTEEFATVRGHPFYTYYLLKPVFTDQRICEWAGFHHEKLDGSGYPFRKKENELSWGSRIVALADTFVALSENRSYRDALPEEETIKIIMEEVNKYRLDGEIAAKIKENYQELKNIMNRVPWDSHHYEK